jgi:hypothetical protein
MACFTIPRKLPKEGAELAKDSLSFDIFAKPSRWNNSRERGDRKTKYVPEETPTIVTFQLLVGDQVTHEEQVVVFKKEK